MKFSLCIEPVFEDVPFCERIQLAKDCGADAVEFWDPWVNGVDPKAIGEAAAKAGMPVAACCLNQAWTYRMNFPWSVVKANVEKSIEIGRAIGCTTFIGLSGELECKADSQKVLLLENLKRTAEIAERAGVTIVLEALNSLYDHKGYYLDSSYVGFELVKAVDSPAIKLLYDCYHMQLMEGNLTNSIRTNVDDIGHFHSAGVPGRHELHKGETNYPFVIQAAEEAGYDRYFGFEYWPTYDNRQSLRDILQYVRG
ncbi:MAG: TIM barrel protein [Oscillospiraceae bacterium]|nr:TIM barrel protein [Oscillospiraceae bacterium]